MNPSVEKAFTNFKQHYQPAYTIYESDEQYSTGEIYSRIQSLTGDDELTTAQVYEMLEQSGYSFDFVMGEYKWLLKITSTEM